MQRLRNSTAIYITHFSEQIIISRDIHKNIFKITHLSQTRPFLADHISISIFGEIPNCFSLTTENYYCLQSDRRLLSSFDVKKKRTQKHRRKILHNCSQRIGSQKLKSPSYKIPRGDKKKNTAARNTGMHDDSPKRKRW